jgi:lysophospholipid acyltransferase (LPLAT)-like uncharacterized protein
MFKLFKELIAKNILQSILYYLIVFYSSLLRVQIKNEEPWIKCLYEGENVILCTFHQQFFLAVNSFRKYRKYSPGLMISKSKDGDIIAGVAKKCGWLPVRGSSSKGGREALYMLKSHLEKNHLAAHIVDGPRGPARKVKSGVIKLAHISNAVIVPFYVLPEKAWYFNSWDNFFIPKPFTKVTLCFGDVTYFKAVINPDEFEKQRKHLETLMEQELSKLKRIKK